MTPHLRGTAAALVLALAAAAAWGQQATPATPAKGDPAKPPRYFEKLTYPKLHDIREPQVVQETLPNGLRLLLVEDHELPQVRLRAMVKGGKEAAPEDRPGLAELFGEVQRTGGVRSMSGDQADEFLERVGASVETDVETGYGTVTGKTLTDTLDQVLPLYAEFLTAPAFAQDKIDLAKTHLKSMIARRNDDVFDVTFREYLKLVYGKDSPQARQYEYDDVDRLTRDDLLSFHKAWYRPDRTILAVWGDFDTAEMKQKLATVFAGWTASGPAPVVPSYALPAPAPSVNYIEKKDVEQAFLLLGHLGVRMDDPDYPAIVVMNDILGSGMSSRIFKEVREKRGLAYAAGGALVPGYEKPGVFYVFASTKPATMSQALHVILGEVERIRQAPVTDAEMRLAKDGYLNSYAFQFDSTGKIVERLQTYLCYGYPLDFNKKLRDAVEKVTKDDVLRVARRDIHPEDLAILAVGRQEQWDKPLSAFGKVNVIDITIPEPSPQEVIPEATAENLKAGTDLLLRAARAAGEPALRSLKAIGSEGTTTVVTPMGEMAIQGKGVVVFPDQLFNELTTPVGPMVQVLDGDKAWLKAGERFRDLPASAVAEMRRGLYTEAGCALVLKKALEGSLQGQLIGNVRFEGLEAEDVLVRLEDGALRVFVSPDGTVLGTRKRGETQEGPAEMVEVFGGYAAVAGLRVPFESTQKVGNEVKARTKLTAVKLNPAVDEGLFSRPTVPAEK